MSKENSNIIPEKIRLSSINIFKANLETTDAYLDNPQQSSSIEFNLAHSIAHNYNQNRSRFRLFFLLNALDKQGNPLGAKVEYGIEFHFEVENFKDHVKKIKNAMEIDIHLAATLFTLSYSTARGIIFERTRGTFFNGAILPVIDPYKGLVERGDVNSS